MLHWLRDFFRAYLGTGLAFELFVLVVLLPAVAIRTCVSSLPEGQFGEAAKATILISIAGAVISFIFWVGYDIKATNRRRELRAKKYAASAKRSTSDLDEHEIDDDSPDLLQSDQIYRSRHQID